MLTIFKKFHVFLLLACVLRIYKLDISLAFQVGQKITAVSKQFKDKLYK